MKNNDLISRSALLESIKQLAKDVAQANGTVDHVTYALKEVFDIVKEAPAVDAVSLGVLEQFKWERDIAISQLEELGIGFGEKKPDTVEVRHHGNTTFVTAADLDSYADRIIIRQGSLCKVYYADNAETIRRGRWKNGCECSECGRAYGPKNATSAPHYHYCTFCGAKMDAEADEK